MAVGLLVDCFFYEFGSGDFLYSFFSTISHNLEVKGWGSKYPFLLNRLYNDKISYSEIDYLQKELNEIEGHFDKMHFEKAIWNIEDLNQNTPWDQNTISSKVINLSTYFATSFGETFFEVFRKAINDAKEDRCDISIRKL